MHLWLFRHSDPPKCPIGFWREKNLYNRSISDYRDPSLKFRMTDKVSTSVPRWIINLKGGALIQNRTLIRSQKGFSLAEAILAMFVLLIGVLAVLQLFPAGIKLSAASRYKTIAANVAQAKMEEIYSLPYDELISTRISDGSPQRINTDPTSPYYGKSQYDRFKRSVTVQSINGQLTPVADAQDDDMTQIIVRVYWTENNQQKKVELATIISKPWGRVVSDK